MIENSRELVEAATTKMKRTKSEMVMASEHVNAANAKTIRIATLLLEFYGLWMATDDDLATASRHVDANRVLLKDKDIEEDLRSIGATDDKALGGMGMRYKESLDLTGRAAHALRLAIESHETIGSNAEDLRMTSSTMRDILSLPGHDIKTAFEHAEAFLQLAGRLTEEDL